MNDTDKRLPASVNIIALTCHCYCLQEQSFFVVLPFC